MDKNAITDVLQDIEDYVANASRVPLTGKVMIDGDQLLELVDRIHALMPEEIKQARQVLDQSDKLLESIESQGKRLLEDARVEASKLVMENEIVAQAQVEAESIINNAQQRAAEIGRDIQNYGDNILGQIEFNLEQALAVVKKCRQDMRGQQA